MIPSPNGTAESSADPRQLGQCNTGGFTAPPFFTNPFMAPFLPQHGPNLTDANSGRSSISPNSSPSPNDPYLMQQQKSADFRLNPLTGGYYLAPNQYQEMMMQHYMQNLMIAAQSNNQVNDLKNMIDPTLSNLLNGSVKPNETSTTQSHVPDAGDLLFPMTSANLDNNHESAAEPHVSSTPPVSSSPSLISSTDHDKSSSPALVENQNQLASSSSSPQPLNCVEDSNTGTQTNSQQVEEEPQKTPTPSPKESRSNSVTNEEPAIKETIESTNVVDEQRPSTSPKSTKSDDSKRPMDPNAVPPQRPVPNTTTEERTSALIKKQMNEIEKEISRRMANQKNIRKIDEKELAQLLNDHGFGSFVDANGSSPEFTADFSNSAHGLPYRPPQDLQQTIGKPTLEQLRSSFSPPSDDQGIQQNLMTDPMHYNFGMTATGSGLGLHGPAAFTTNPILPQSMSPAAYQNQPTMANGHYTTTIPAQQSHLQFMNANAHNQNLMSNQLLNGMNGSPFNYMNFVQGQPVNQMPPNASYGMPQNYPQMTPTITPELAAALLQQLQQQNPALLQNLVGQHHFANSTSQPTTNNGTNQNVNNQINAHRFNGNVENAVKCTAVPQSPPAQKTSIASIPAPPTAHNAIHRKHIGDGQTSTSTQRRPTTENGWPTTSNATSNGDQEPGCENKENGDVWVMRETFLKRRERDEQRRQNGCIEPEQSTIESESQQNADIEEEETDKLLKKDHNDSVEEALRQRKGSQKKEVLIEGVLFRARYLGSTQLVNDGRATKSSRMAQAQEAVSRVKAPDGETQPSTEIDLFISTEKIMVLNTDLQDIVIDLVLKSVSYIADIGSLVVLIARRLPQNGDNGEEDIESIRRTPRMICHVFESEEASFIVQSIGQAFQVAYVEFLRANGIDDPSYLSEVNYQEVLNSQELMGEELEMFARKETQKDVVVPKKVGEALGVVVVESGWGSMLPTVVLANLSPGGPAARSNQLNIGDQIIAINGISLVGLPLLAAQQNIKNAKTSTAVRLTVVSTPPVVEVQIKRPDTKYQLGFSVQNGVICSLLRGGIAERGGIRVGHRIIEINNQSVVAVQHEKIVNMLATASGTIHIKTMPTSMFRLLTGQEQPNYI